MPEFSSQNQAPRLQPGDLLEGKWEIEASLGQGGMGQVYLARELALERKVAIKVLAESFAEDASAKERLAREARLMARLDHPHIVPVFGVGVRNGHPFIVMKYLEGQSLRERLQQGPLSRAEVLAVLQQLASAVDHIHANGLIHRDLKPSNVFVRADGMVTLLDFGISRDVTAATQTSERAGSAHYMAPEQLQGEPFDHRADLYALGVMLFELVTGKPPYTAESEASLVYQQVHAPVPRADQRSTQVGHEVSQVLTRAMAKKPEARFNTAEDLHAALAAAFASDEEGGGSSLASQVARRPSRWVAILLGALLLIGAITGAALWSSRGKAHFVPTTSAAPTPVVTTRTPVTPAPLSTPPPPTEPDRPETTATATASKPLPAPSAPKRHLGELSVVTSFRGEPVWASVYLDGAYAGGTPLSLHLKPGRHTLRVERKGYRTMTRTLHVKAGQPTSVRLDLET